MAGITKAPVWPAPLREDAPSRRRPLGDPRALDGLLQVGDQVVRMLKAN
jgi:hypothetical protein